LRWPCQDTRIDVGQGTSVKSVLEGNKKNRNGSSLSKNAGYGTRENKQWAKLYKKKVKDSCVKTENTQGKS